MPTKKKLSNGKEYFSLAVRARVADFVDEQLEELDMGDLRNRVSEDWEVYDQEQVDRNAFEGCSVVRSGVVRSAVDAKVMQFDLSILRKPNKYRVTPILQSYDPEFSTSQAELTLRKAWDYVFDHEAGIAETLRSDTTDLCVQGFTILKIVRKKIFDTLPNINPEGGKVDIQIVPISDVVTIERVPYDRFFCSDEYENIEDAPFLAQIVQKTRFELEYMKGVRGWDSKAIEQAVEQALSQPQQVGSSASGLLEATSLPSPTDRPEENPLITLYEFYGLFTPDITGFQYPVRLFGLYDRESKNVLYVDFLALLDPENKYPFEVPILYPAYDVGPRWWGYGVPRWHQALSDIVDDAINRARDDALVFGRPPIKYNPLDPELTHGVPDIGPWAEIPATSPNNVEFMTFPQPAHQLNLEQFGIFSDLYQKATAVYPETLGDLSGLKTHQSPTSIQSILQQGQAFHAADGIRIAEAYQRLFRRVAARRVMLLRLRENPDEDPLFRIMRPEEWALFLRLSMDERAILSEYSFTFDIRGLVSSARAQSIFVGLQALQGSPMNQLFPEKLHNLIVDFMSYMDVPKSEELRVTAEETVDRQASIQVGVLLQASGKERSQFMEGLTPEALAKFQAILSAVDQARGGQV